MTNDEALNEIEKIRNQWNWDRACVRHVAKIDIYELLSIHHQKMPKSKYDREKLKIEYFESKHNEVKSFFCDKWVPYNSLVRRKTNWRPSQKKKHKALIVEEALKMNAEKQINELQVPLEDLMKWKKTVIQLLLLQVWKYVKDNRSEDWKLVKDIDVWNAERILHMFKTELWEPNTIGANYNMNANKVEWLSEEESEALDVLFQTKVWKNKKQ